MVISGDYYLRKTETELDPNEIKEYLEFCKKYLTTYYYEDKEWNKEIAERQKLICTAALQKHENNPIWKATSKRYVQHYKKWEKQNTPKAILEFRKKRK